jgi:hypothetical protein
MKTILCAKKIVMGTRKIRRFVRSLLFEYSEVISALGAPYWSKLLKCVPAPSLMQNLKHFPPIISVDSITPVKSIEFIYTFFMPRL